MTNKKIKEQFETIFEENIGIILKISRAFARTTYDRDDLINDIALELWKSFPRFKGNSKLSTWIYRVALNTSMNYKRKKKKNLVFFSEIKQSESIARMVEEEEDLNTDILYKCIDELNELNKAIIILYLDGNSHDEIAEITGISKSNVGTRIGRIKEQIKKIVKIKNEYYGTN